MGMDNSDNTAEEPAAEAAGPFALTITGLVNNEQAWTEAEVQAMETTDAEDVNNKGETDTYTGVTINSLLALAGVQADATTVVFVTAGDETLEMTLADLEECADCILSFRNQGGFSTVLPGFSDLPRLRDVVEIIVRP